MEYVRTDNVLPVPPFALSGEDDHQPITKVIPCFGDELEQMERVFRLTQLSNSRRRLAAIKQLPSSQQREKDNL
jgi:hypothetical protein